MKNLLPLPESVIREYKSFIFSHYVGEGVRITAGLVLPAVAFSYFGMLELGIVMSLGALATSIPDSPGPIHHRKNAMIICLLLISFGSFVTGMLTFSPLLLGIWIAVASFLFSIIGVFNTRSMAIGSAVLFVMVLTIDQKNNIHTVLIHSALVLAGGVWYTLLSLLLYSIRPYKLTQQALGDCIESTAAYLRVKASFYKKDVDYDASYRQLLEEQIHVHQHQELVRDLLFKSRYIVRESTLPEESL